MFNDKKEKQLAQMAMKLNEEFWYTWNDMTKPFPDIAEADYCSILVLQTAMGLIFSCYLKGFQPHQRNVQKEMLLQKLRMFSEADDLFEG